MSYGERTTVILGLLSVVATFACGNRRAGVPGLVGSQVASREPVFLDSVPGAVPSERARGDRAPAGLAQLGYNLDFPGYWSTAMPFIDLIKNSSGWMGVCHKEGCDGHAKLRLDPQGWPTEIPPEYQWIEVVLASLEPGHPYVGLSMVVTWEGQGTFEAFNMGDFRVMPSLRRATFTLRPDNMILRLRTTDPLRNGDYVRNVRVFRADWEKRLQAGERLNPDYRDFLRPFGTLRFMDWMLANNPQPADVTWAMRSRPEGAWWLGQFRNPAMPRDDQRSMGGYPPEVLVDVANELQAAPHFCLPYRATDEYITEFARLIRDRLDPRLRATFELGNETWNFGLPAAGYANQQGRARWPELGSAWVVFNGVQNSRMCRLIKQVFAGATQRVRCLMTPQTGNIGLAKEHLDCPAHVDEAPNEREPCWKAADAIAITGYFDGGLQKPESFPVLQEWLARGNEYALDRAFRALEFGDVEELPASVRRSSLRYAQGDQLGTFAAYSFYARLAAERHLELYVYEGGTHFDLPRDAPDNIQALLLAMTRDPRMTRLYQENFKALFAARGSVFNLWGWMGRDSVWANAEHPLDRRHAKYRSVLEWVGTSAPR